MTPEQKAHVIRNRRYIYTRPVIISLMSCVSNRFAFDVNATTYDGIVKSKAPSVISELPKNHWSGTVIILRNEKRSCYVGCSSSTGARIADSLVYFSEIKPIPLSQFSEMTIDVGDIENYTGKGPLKTTFGRYMVNYALCVRPYIERSPKDFAKLKLLEFINEPFAPSKIDNWMAAQLEIDNITCDEIYRTIDIATLINITDLAAATATAKSFTTSTEVPGLRKQLLKEYGSSVVSDPLKAAEFEAKLEKVDAEFTKGDSSMIFYKAFGARTHTTARKKLFLAIGGIPAFKKGAAEYTFLPYALTEGHDPKYFDTVCNEIYKGSYDRGKKTAEGGLQTKFVLRILQDLTIKDQDCGTTHGIDLTLTKEISAELSGRGRNIVVNKRIVKLTDEMIPTLLGKTIRLRSPMTCATKGGFCYTCFGELMRTIGVHGVAMQVVDLSSVFTQLAMKNMHGTKIETVRLDFTKFIVKD